MKQRETQRGTAILMVVTLTAIMALMMLVLINLSRGSIETNARFVDTIRDRQAARAAVEFGLSTLRNADLLTIRSAREPLVVQWGDYLLIIQITPESGRINLNTADDSYLESSLLTDLSTDEEFAAIQAILDWRDDDEVARPMGAERDDYLALGLSPPRNGPFYDLAELAQVRGVTPNMLDRWLPQLTIFDGEPFAPGRRQAEELVTEESADGQQEEDVSATDEQPQEEVKTDTQRESDLPPVRIIGTAIDESRTGASLMVIVEPETINLPDGSGTRWVRLATMWRDVGEVSVETIGEYGQ